MSFEIPSVRIRQLQAGLRREAGVPSYDPDDPSIPPLPSVGDVVAALDPDLPPSLRCGRCRGGLLRGPQSTVCIYCGADRAKEGFSHSISFNSTVGCRKLLDFLGLDGSEAVLLDTEPNGSKKGQDTPKAELVLSELLDLQLKWPSDKVHVENNTTITTSSPNAYALSLTGVDLDNFFSERKRDTSSIAPEPNEKLTLSQNTNIKYHASSGSESFAAFEKLQTTDTKTSSLTSDFGGSFAVWDADFQPASTKTSDVSPKSLDLFQDSSGHDLAHAPRTEATIDQPQNIEMFGGIESKSGPPSSVNKQFHDDFWPLESVKIDASDLLKHETHDGTMNNASNSMSNSGIGDFSDQEDMWPTSSTKKSEISSHINSNDDYFDVWQDFTSSVKAKGTSSSPGPKTGPTFLKHSSETKAEDLFPASSKNELGNNKSVGDNNDSVADWQDFTSFERQGSSLSLGTQSGEHPLELQSVGPLHTSSKMESESSATMNIIHDSSDAWQDITGSSEELGDLFNQGVQNGVTPFKDSSETQEVDLWPTCNTKHLDKNKPLDGDEDPFNDWPDFTSFAVGPERSLNLGVPSGPTLFEQPLETKSVDIQPTIGKVESTNEHDDSFDYWQDFTISMEVKGSSSSSGEQSKSPLFGHPSETNLVHQQDMKTDGSSDALEGQKGYPDGKDIPLDALAYDRTNEKDQKTAMDSHSMIWDAKETIESSNANPKSESAESNVEKLVSQMHDLSFMLADELSIPEKHVVSKQSVTKN